MSNLYTSRHRPLGPPPVEPLSDISWQRVERAVFAELDAQTAPSPVRPARSTRRWAISLVPLAAAAAAVALWLAVQRRGEHHETPSRVVTNGAPTEVSFGDAVITAESHSALVLRGSANEGALIVLERGGATFEVAPRKGRPPFTVQAGEVSVRVVGTRFVVSRSGDAASIQVLEGTVEVVSRGRRAFLEAGDSWPSGSDREAAARGTTTPDVAAAPLSPPPDAEPPKPPRKRVTSSRGREPAEARPDDEDDATVRPPTTKEQYDAAAWLEASQPAAALGRYRELARGSGPWAANALFAAVRLSFDRGDHDEAKRLLSRYLRRFPGGANAADARALLDRLGSE